MKNINKLIYPIIYIIGLLILLGTSTNKYQWMQGMDKTIVQLPEDSSANTAIGMTILTLILVIMQIIHCKFARSRLEKNAVIILAVLTSMVWAIKFS
ncbi:MAG: hypothetical protein J6586_05535 [Snodgrassella sp.]|uniref:hypothetical protein n=1 Tax=Snodgrassella communis TaxID=2946699 RepID=UPI001EF61052|nr:hypothetical protein [Snodgrassella communis]MCO6515948.1 hypothetical protein [Snodgrassella sp.]